MFSLTGTLLSCHSWIPWLNHNQMSGRTRKTPARNIYPCNWWLVADGDKEQKNCTFCHMNLSMISPSPTSISKCPYVENHHPTSMRKHQKTENHQATFVSNHQKIGNHLLCWNTCVHCTVVFSGSKSGKLNPALNGLYLLMRHMDLSQTRILARSRSGTNLVVIC